MLDLGEFHKRRILVTFQHVEKLLSQSLTALTRSQSDLRQPGIQDISPSKRPQIENHMKQIRKLMRSFLDRSNIVLPEPSTPSSWILRTNMTSVDIALEDLYPKKMKGYGDMDSAAAAELTKTLQEIRKQVTLLLQALDQD